MTSTAENQQLHIPDLTARICEYVAASAQTIGITELQEHFCARGLNTAQIAAANAYGVQQHLLIADSKFRISAV